MNRRKLLQQAGLGAVAATPLATALGLPAAARAQQPRQRPRRGGFRVDFAVDSRLNRTVPTAPIQEPHNIFIDGGGTFDGGRIDLSGSVTHYIVGPAVAGVFAFASFRAIRFDGFTPAPAINPASPTFGQHLGGILKFRAQIFVEFPDERTILGDFTVVSNLLPDVQETGQPTGVFLDEPGAFAFEPRAGQLAGVLFSVNR